MSDLTIYGMVLSQPVRSVILFCRLSNIQFSHQSIATYRKENLTEEFTRINPIQTIPAIVHNGYNLWESAAIVPYLADAFNVDNQWYPKDIKIRGRINAYLHWHHQTTRAPLTGYVRAKIIAPAFYGAPKLTEETEAPFKAAVEEWFQTFKWQLAETGYAARTQGLTIADIFAYNELVTVSRIVDISAHPEVKMWFDEIGAIPAVQEMAQEALQIFAKIIPSDGN
jgi:glutathione S-transferase